MPKRPSIKLRKRKRSEEAPTEVIGEQPSRKRRPLRSPSQWPTWARRLAAFAVLLIVAGAGFAIGYLVDGDEEATTVAAPAPAVIVEPEPEQAEEPALDEIGFPAFATRNTTRVGGADPIADAAGVALASFPSVGGVEPPLAAVLAPAESWQESLVAASLAADPIAAPILLSEPGEVPPLTAQALEQLQPAGLERADGAELIAIGDVAVPEELETLRIRGSSPAAIAAAVVRERARLSGEERPEHLLIVSSEDPGLAMPAAAWAAVSGDPILFAAGDEVPEETLEVVAENRRSPVYVLGPDSAISKDSFTELEKEAESVTRVGDEDPVENSIEFARFLDGSFGWNVNDPGHGFTIANLDRPADAAAAAALAAGGKPGPLLITDDARNLPGALQGYLLDTKPGFEDDPSRALYNHVWLIGDNSAMSIAFQAQVDAATELAPVSSGTRPPEFAPAPNGPEAEEEAGSGSTGRDERGSRQAGDDEPER